MATIPGALNKAKWKIVSHKVKYFTNTSMKLRIVADALIKRNFFQINLRNLVIFKILILFKGHEVNTQMLLCLDLIRST